MGYELDQLMKRNGVSTAGLPQYSGAKAPSDTEKTTKKYYTAPIEPTEPVMPTIPTAFTGVAPIAPAKLGKGATAEQTAGYKVSDAQYLADLNTFNADKAASIKATTDYDASLKSYPDLMKTYNTNLTKFNTDKTTWDELQRKYDLDQKSYNTYVDEYKNRIANTPQYDPLPKATGQTRPNTSMGQRTLPETLSDPGISQTSSDISEWASQNPYATTKDVQKYQDDYGLTGRDLYNATGSFYGNQLKPPAYGELSKNFNNLTPQQQASNYAQQLNTGYTDADIRSKFAKQFGSPMDANWTAMQDLASPPVESEITPAYTDGEWAYNKPQKLSDQHFRSGATGTVYNAYDPEYYTSRSDLYTPVNNVASLPVNNVASLPVNNVPPTPVNNVPPTPVNTLQKLSGQQFKSNATGTVFKAWDPKYYTSRPDLYTPVLAEGGSVHDLYRKYANGGHVAHYADAGSVDIANSVMPRPEEGVPQPLPQIQMQAAAPQQDDRMAQLQAMMEKYATPQNDYARELEEARRKSNAETEAFTDMVKNARKSPERDNMSQAERYFRLAAAFGQPTKTGSLGETLGNVSQAMAENEKSKKDSQDQNLELQMKAQQLKTAGAKEDLNTLRVLSSEDKKTQREIVSSMIKAEIESGKPQSELAKIAKDRYGYGTQGYYSFLEKNVPTWVESKMAQMQMGPMIAQGNLSVAQGNLQENQERTNISQEEHVQKLAEMKEKQSQMSQQELKMKTDLQNEMLRLESASDTLNRAYQLNSNSFDNTVTDRAKRMAIENTVGSKDEKVKNTRELETFLGESSLNLAQDLKGSVSDSDMKLLSSLTGAKTMGVQERADILHKNWTNLQRNLELKKKQYNDVISKRARLYDERAPEQ